MLRFRVDDYPQTKGEPQHTPTAFREFHRCLSECLGGKRYLLGVIPGRCTVDDLLLIRNETDVVVGMHGINHDEKRLDLIQSEFPYWMAGTHIIAELRKYREPLELAVGRPVTVYMPPRNYITQGHVLAMPLAGFDYFTTGPETEPAVREMAGAIDSQPPHAYGRTDEMLTRGSDKVLTAMAMNNEVVVALHWTWETNIGLTHMRRFFEGIPKDLIADFDV